MVLYLPIQRLLGQCRETKNLIRGIQNEEHISEVVCQSEEPDA
jgi:hypothetical protein